jgi:hypothetical protein
MVISLFLAAVLTLQGQQVVTQGGPPPAPVPKDAPKTLPDTPQGRHVKAFVQAFNSGDEETFLKTQESVMTSDTLAKRPAADRAKMFKRMKGDFGTLTITRVAATPDKIRMVVLDKDGNEAIFSFEFESKAPYKIKSIGVDIGNVER